MDTERLGYEPTPENFVEQASHIISQIDFDRLDGVFKSQLGSYETESKFPNAGDIEIAQGMTWDDINGQFDTENSKITIYPEAIAKNFDHQDFPVTLVHVVCHEGTHMVANNMYKGNLNQESGYNKVSPESYDTESEKERKIKKGQLIRHDIYSLFNEAVTEKISREVFKDYILGNQKIVTKEAAESYLNRLSNEAGDIEKYKHYGPEVILLDQMISKMAEELEISQESIWHSIKRGYFEEGSSIFEDPEVIAGFADIFSKDFLENLSKYGYDNVDELMFPDKAARKVQKEVTGKNPLPKLIMNGVFIKAFGRDLKLKLTQILSRDPLY